MSDETDQLRRSWTANADAWCDAVRNQRIESRRLVTDAAIVDAVLAQHPHRVLDLGCGEGWLARVLSAHGIDVTGVDASAPLIDAARASGGGTFHVLAYEDLSSLGDFDLVVANFSLLDDQTTDVLRALQTPRLIVQTVRTGGDGDEWRTETFDAFPGHWPEAMPWFFRTRDSWLRVFEDAGFDRVETRETQFSLLFVAEKANAARS
ncbi:MAG TPA: class I SAM-dependent methyltransferase [Thermoanaerobaculia bacterium]